MMIKKPTTADPNLRHHHGGADRRHERGRHTHNRQHPLPIHQRSLRQDGPVDDTRLDRPTQRPQRGHLARRTAAVDVRADHGDEQPRDGVDGDVEHG